MQKRHGQGETEANTKGGTEEAKGGAKMQKINREDVVQAALIVERWCGMCRGVNRGACPFARGNCCVLDGKKHEDWNLAEFLSTRGLKDG